MQAMSHRFAVSLQEPTEQALPAPQSRGVPPEQAPPLQLAPSEQNRASQASPAPHPQTPPWQVSPAGAHDAPQAPQLDGSVSRLVSQPSVRLSPLQSS